MDKGKINADGVLEIERAGKFKPMECKPMEMTMPSSSDVPIASQCGDDCSLFHEPEKMMLPKDKFYTQLRICQGGYWYFDGFEDER